MMKLLVRKKWRIGKLIMNIALSPRQEEAESAEHQIAQPEISSLSRIRDPSTLLGARL